ncbi:MAG: electron transfer flavoprotein subunit beta/FixA family protein [Candidatus Marinimicrobia bacterium]|nr:electron transfer flavoprotein subunit beta/FixA family protein [Candidatus Neomarinimicrobiota bacterium]MCF7851351.1 electron transfer flavoprotein subunit beta/FixA family protein [Candidatus Neomarinimicrobiota bacterium]MCF7905171.1 electron transfer flavoprotein subunit beta/FixA family protein [Candidatus Neomarinimicrobiota bacterium]
MSLHTIVLVKQVPDTSNISGDVMRPDGTVNRAKLPAIFNPEDKEALELALRLKDQHGGHITVLTMGPPNAANMLRECLYMGADRAILVSDRRFAAADTLATSYALYKAIQHIGEYDLIFGGRQAIDGDTAQVGPQTAEKLNIPQISYTLEIQDLDLKKRRITAKRAIKNGYEVLEAPLPVLLTVTKDAADPRPFDVKRLCTYKRAQSKFEVQALAEESHDLVWMEDLLEKLKAEELYIETWNIEDIDADVSMCGLAGSPTKVHKVENVVLSGSEFKEVPPTQEGMTEMIEELMQDHIFG